MIEYFATYTMFWFITNALSPKFQIDGLQTLRMPSLVTKEPSSV